MLMGVSRTGIGEDLLNRQRNSLQREKVWDIMVVIDKPGTYFLPGRISRPNMLINWHSVQRHEYDTMNRQRLNIIHWICGFFQQAALIFDPMIGFVRNYPKANFLFFCRRLFAGCTKLILKLMINICHRILKN